MKQSRAIRYAKSFIDILEQNSLEKSYSDIVLIDNVYLQIKIFLFKAQSKTDLKLKF